MDPFLTTTELHVAAAVHKLHGTGYGVSIRMAIADATQRDMVIGTIYAALERLEKRKLVESRWGDTTPERGGKRKRLFHLTGDGVRVMSETLAGLDRLRDGAVVDGAGVAV